jgi:hypothetical protein
LTRLPVRLPVQRTLPRGIGLLVIGVLMTRAMPTPNLCAMQSHDRESELDSTHASRSKISTTDYVAVHRNTCKTSGWRDGWNEVPWTG